MVRLHSIADNSVTHAKEFDVMISLSTPFIKHQVADSPLIFERGYAIYEHGSYYLAESQLAERRFSYKVDGIHGDYTTTVSLTDNGAVSSCSCPYPGSGCKHVVAAMLNARDILARKGETPSLFPEPEDEESPYLTEDEIRELALEDREKRGRTEAFTAILGDMFKGDHLVETRQHRQYRVTLHDPEKGVGHCSCPDFLTNGFGLCKHLVFLLDHVKKQPDYHSQVSRERFPFIDLFWDSVSGAPKVFFDRPDPEIHDLVPLFRNRFDASGNYRGDDLAEMMTLFKDLREDKRVCIRESLLVRLDRHLQERQLEKLGCSDVPVTVLKAGLYPYQEAGVRFGIFRQGVLIGDEMGLGKTVQAIALAVIKKQQFGFQKTLVITLASLKEQWRREIETFSDETAAIVEGSPDARRTVYQEDASFFKITNYEAVLRDVTLLSRFRPDIVILDEAQRIKNFSTKTAEAVKQIPRKHGIVLTGTPLENRLEDVYSIVQFLDPYRLTPLWKFAADHFMIDRKKKNGIAGYRNLGSLKEKLKDLVIRRTKNEVLDDLPDEIVNTYYVALHEKQHKIHAGYLQSLLPLIGKKFLTPMDLRKIQMLLLKMRMVCNSTYLIDRKTHISPKLRELEGILDEVVIQNGRKVVIFSEWTTMTYLIARHLSDAGIPFVELSGKIPVKKRQRLIDEFTANPSCKVFLSTDAGGTGLNLQAADCVINVELPWNPARMKQRIGRVNRIGQKSSCINVINLISKQTIEEKILAGIQLKTDLFSGVFDDDGPDTVEFTQEKKNALLNELRALMNEEEHPGASEFTDAVEISEDTPHFLNPDVLSRETEIDPEAFMKGPGETEQARKEIGYSEGDDVPETAGSGQDPSGRTATPPSDNPLGGQEPERIESVLNAGMSFLTGLMEMATGQKMESAGDDGRMIAIDRTTGEVTLKFKLPGFSRASGQ